MKAFTTPDFEALIKKWPSAVVARHNVDQFTGGLVHPRTLANLDSKGEGPPVRHQFGRKVFYPVVPFVEWMKSRSNK